MLRFRLLAVVGALSLLGCERSRGAPDSDSIPSAGATAESATPAPVPSGWDTTAGAYLLIPGLSPTEAMLVDPEQRGTISGGSLPDSAAVVGRRAILLNASGARHVAWLSGPLSQLSDDGCVSPWPVVHLSADSTIGAWQLGFVDGAAVAIAADSLSSLASSDSSALVASAARLASALPVRDEAYFRGLPFAVRSLQRFSPATGVQAVAVSLVRRVSQEDSPLEERTFIVAERESLAAPWRVAYHERATGSEDEVASAESIAPLLLGAQRRPALLVVHEESDGVSYRLIERTGAARWRLQWRSATGKC